MAFLGGLARALATGSKVVQTSASITGAGGIATGLSKISSAVCAVTDSGATAHGPWTVVTQSSRSGGTVNVVVVDVTDTPTVAKSVAAHVIDCLAVGT